MSARARPFELLLFTADPALARRAATAGIDGIIIDWETRGKDVRQATADTQINRDTIDDLGRVREATGARIICRVNGISDTTASETDAAIAAGADEILLPMVRSAREVECVLEHVNGRSGVGILIETVEAVACAASFQALPLSRVYVGLNDLAIARGTSNIFSAVIDGTVERIRSLVTAPFGFGGLTLPDRGYPVPCGLLMEEMARLDCHFSFLRRSFHRDVRGLSMDDAVTRIRRGLAEAHAQVAADGVVGRARLEQAIAGWDLARAASS